MVNEKENPGKVRQFVGVLEDTGKRIVQEIVPLLGTSLVTFVVSLLVFRFIITPVYIPTESMYPTIKVGNVGFCNKMAYRFGKVPERGDIVIIDGDEKNLCKRIVGLPGEYLEIRTDGVYINGAKLDESEYLAQSFYYPKFQAFNIPDDCYIVLGDNRNNSADSRYWDDPYVKKENVVGKFLRTPFAI